MKHFERLMRWFGWVPNQTTFPLSNTRFKISWLNEAGDKMVCYDRIFNLQPGDSLDFGVLPKISVERDNSGRTKISDSGLQVFADAAEITRDNIKTIRLEIVE